MTDQERLQRNTERLQELDPLFAIRVKSVLDGLEARALRPRIQDAWRSPAAQMQAYLGGFSRLRFGFHNVTNADGKPAALAADILDDDAPTAPASFFLLQLAALAEQAGLRSGIRWGLLLTFARAIDRAIAAQDWHAGVKIGWDPTHIETQAVTVAQARSGQRPTN